MIKRWVCFNFIALPFALWVGGGRGAAAAESVPNDAPYRNAALPIEQRVTDLLGRMTLEEKVGQLHQTRSSRDGQFNQAKFEAEFRSGTSGAMIWSLPDVDQRNGLQHIAVEQSRLGVPILFGEDIIHGCRTTFPISLGLSCAFDPTLYEQSQTIAARESRAMGIDWVFAPMCDLARDPRWGRVAETCGEDPYLAAECIAAAVKGFQGDHPFNAGAADDITLAADRVACCLKHFVGYSAVVGGRDYNATDVTETALRNLYLPSFHAGIDAGALSVMSGFNEIDGVPAADNHHAMTDILRNEWGFRGFVVSDFDAVSEAIDWGYAADPADAARRSIAAGNDMEMNSSAFNTLVAQVKEGQVPQATIDKAVARILRVKFEIGLFEHPFADASASAAAMLRPDALQLARQCVARSAVLLKNDGVLPISKQVKKLALIGPFADDGREMIGCWGGKGNPKDVVTLAAGIRQKLGAGAEIQVVAGCDILSGTPMTHVNNEGRIVPDSTTAPASQAADGKADAFADAVRAAQGADVVIMALGEAAGWTGENASRATLGFTGRQQELFDAVAATGKPVTVVVFSGRPLALPQVAAKAAGLMFAWQPGVQAGNGLADLLFGDAEPVGRLTMSVPVGVGQVPIYYNHLATGRPGNGNYRDFAHEPMYEFGYGLTGTTFGYSAVKIDATQAGHPAVATATITNTGKRLGEEVAQLYVRQMACAQGARPTQELRGFRHVKLEAGQSAEVSFELNDSTLGYVDRNGQAETDDGVYDVWIAPHAGTGVAEKYERRR